MKKIIGLLVLAFDLSGCVDGDRYNFSGSSENWDVFYVVDVSDGTNQEKSGTIKYVGEGNAPEMIDYEIEASGSGSEGTGITLNEGTADTGRSSCEGCAVIQEDEEIEVEITWNGQTENLLLTTDN
ncbi:hypothetical protein BBI15_14985 [Planococcus plakortidis]|uniref:Uncharacterized protein n=1 Tax=Planococcus plakortidis TaxID=1038856 RepID=A0A1C7ECB9_9BACL|nr:hypothetical protein [Planococcus plakortidis]ANU21388.1 hypothetical protein BBI15_14985 [Planococcus plakortidis]